MTSALYDRIGINYAQLRKPDPRIRSGISSFWKLDDVHAGLAALQQDLASGEWERRYAQLLATQEYDAGYRLVVAEP